MAEQFVSNSEEETEALGRRLGEILDQSTVVAFTGDLGAGKTAFIRGLAKGLDIPDRVTSPTFTIVNEYEGGAFRCFILICTGCPLPTSCSTSVGRTTWPEAACVPWSGARM